MELLTQVKDLSHIGYGFMASYVNSPAAAAYLDVNAPLYFGDYFRAQAPIGERLLCSLFSTC